jgi:hypothetical protein
MDRDCCVFLVGDAAFGVPYFRALNNGLLCGTKLAETLAAVMWQLRTGGAPAACASALKEYADAVRTLATREIGRAKLKQAGLSTVDMFMSVKGLAPSMLQPWDAETVQRVTRSGQVGVAATEAAHGVKELAVAGAAVGRNAVLGVLSVAKSVLPS